MMAMQTSDGARGIADRLGEVDRATEAASANRRRGLRHWSVLGPGRHRRRPSAGCQTAREDGIMDGACHLGVWIPERIVIPFEGPRTHESGREPDCVVAAV